MPDNKKKLKELPPDLDGEEVAIAPAKSTTPLREISASDLEGGELPQENNLWQTNKPAYVDSVLNANKHLDWVSRLHDKNPESIQVEGEKFPSTHLMSDNGEGYIFPRIQKVNGKLKDLGNKAEDYARETNTGIQLPKEQGTWFANNGYKTGSNVLQGSLSPEERNKILGIQDKQDVVNNIFGKDISGNPIINTTPHNSPQQVDPKEETNQAVNILANHVVQNALPHYEGNLKNTQFTEPGNVVHDITNPHGDAQMTGSYAKYGIEQLKLQRQQELGQLAQSGGSTNPDYQQQEDAINSKYNEQIGALQNAAKHLISLQLANREYTAKKYTQAEADDKISDLDKEYKKELSTATGGGDINIAKTAFEKAKAEIKRNTKYDAVQLGIEQRKMFGDKSAEEDLVKYNNGQPIPEDRKVAYQLNGLNIIQTGARNAAANGQDDVAKDMSDNSSDIQERLEKDNPRYFQKQYAQQIGSYLYNNEHNPLFGTLFARGVPEEDKIKAAGQAAGLTPAQIRQVRPEDIPTTASMLGQAAQGAFNAFLFQNDKDPYGELFTGKMPQEQHTFNNWRGVTGEIASGAGTIAGFLAQGGIIGEGLKSGEILGNVATNAKNYETASNLIPLALSNYNNAYEQSKEIIGDKPKDELKRHAYAALNATISTAIMSIDPATAIGKDALGATNEGRDIIGMLKKDGLSNISPIDFKDKIAPIIAHAATAGEETAKHIGSQALIMASNKAAENVTDMFFDPEHRHGIMDNVGQSAIQGGISMFLPSLFAGINTSRMENPSNKELLWDVGNNSKDYRAQVTDLYKQGKMSQGDFLTSINGINKAAGIIKSDVPSTNAVSDVPLTDQQKKDYAWNLLQTNEVTDKIAALGEKSDKSQVKLLNDRLTELTGERSKILDKAGEEILVEKPVLKPQENISEKPTKKSKEELSLNSDNSSQQNVTSNGQKTSNEQDNGQSRSKESEAQDIGPNSELRQAAGMEGVAGEENRQVEAPGGTNNKEGGAEMQPPISVSNKERRKRKPLVVDEEPIPVIEEPNLQTQDLGEVKGQPEAKTEEQLKEATVNHPEKPADVLVSEKPQGESFNDAKDRYKKTVDEIAKDAPDNTVVVTHSWGLKLLDAVEKTGWDHPELAAEHQKGSTETGDLIPYKMEDGRTIWFARHGETEDNTNDLQRTDDTPLTKKGIEQAKEIAHKLKEKGIIPSQIITSDLARAKETSDIISKEFKTEADASTQSKEQQQEIVQQGSEPEHARTEPAGSEKPTTETAGSDSNERSERGQEAKIKTPEGFTASKSNDTRKDGKHIFKKQEGDISHEIVVKDDGSAYVTTTDKKSLTGVDEHSKSMESDIKEFKNIDEAIKYIDEQKLSVKFKTSKGSEYILHADGTTTRNKAAREDVGHEGEQGIQPRSEKTYFITKEDLGKLDLVQTSGWPEGEKPTIADLGNGKIAVGITGGERHGKYMPETEVKYRTEPQTGLYPLEVLKGGTVHHFGNEITSVENTGKPQETPQSNGAIATEATKEQPAQPPKEKTSQERLSEIEEDLKKQRASQKLESEKRTKAEKEKDIPAANKANENWHKKKEKIDKLEEEKESIQKKMEREEREESIKKVYNDFADKLQNKYEANKEKHKGVALSGIVGLSTKIGDHVADFVVTRAIEGIRELSNIHIAIDRAIRLAKEKFGAEADDLSKKDINSIRTHLIEQLGQKEPSIDKEPVLPIDHEEYAKDILADIKNGHITAEEGLQEVANEQIVNRQGQPVSDHVSENNKAKIQNYIKWHIDQDVTSIRNATTRLRREQFGLNEEIPAAKKEFGKTWEEAQQKIEDNPQKIPELIHELSQKARPLTDVENAILLHHQNTKEIELLNFNDKINKAAEEGNQAEINEYKASKSRVLDELQQIYDINKAVGTENARGLSSRRMMVDRKYSLVNMLSEKRATANEGKPLSEQQQAEVEDLHKKIKETQDAFDEYIKKSESQIIDLQRKALNGKLKDKKTASTKLREWAERIRNASKNQAYSSPIPITPHMVADAIDLIAYGVEKGEQLVDLVKRAVAATSKGNPGIDEDHLEREINKALIDSGILEVSPERRAATDMSGLFSNGKLNREAIRLKTEADRAKAQYDINIKKDQQDQLSGLAKAQNLFVKWERAFKLSNPLTMGKLAMAGLTRLVTTPLEDIVGGAYSAILPQLAKGSIGEGGGLNISETARTYKNGLMMGIKDAKQIMSKQSQGKSELDVLFGKAGELPPEAIDFFGQLHSATKAPIKRVMFERSLERRLRRNIANGVDVTDPMVQTSVMVGAYKDANRAIFMQDNKVAEAWQKLIKHFEQIDPKTNEPRMQGVATAMQVLVPFVKVPSNIVAETGKHIYGVPVALYKLAVARFKGGIESLTEDQKDIILRNLKKGSLGVAAMALGYYNAQNFGGYYQPGQKRKEEDAEALGFKFYGHKVPAWVGEAPIFQAMQLGATVKRVSDHYIEGEKQGLPEGVITGLLDVVQSNPLASQPLRISALFKSSKERQYYLGELAKSTVDPAIITYLAKVTDPADKGNPVRKALAPENKRKTPKTIVDHIKSGLPFLREQLPTKEEDWSQ